MTTDSTRVDPVELRDHVMRLYEDLARGPGGGFPIEAGRPLAERLGYPPAELDLVPAGAVESFAGAGYHLDLAAPDAGDSVLDLGSGSGTDSFIAAGRVGPEGRVLGIDMTPAQVEKARALAREGGFAPCEFREGSIEEPGLEPVSFDCVISNGAVNLSPRKTSVFASAALALRAGGRLAMSDIVTEHRLPGEVSRDPSLWAAGVGGAMRGEDLRGAIESAGLRVEEWRTNGVHRSLSDGAGEAVSALGLTGVSLLAVKP
ncbi:MAG: methyltransferase domain-containing protein [Miltoncostaeaceae bacterium]